MDDAGKVKVWDPLVRLFHWTLVASFTAAYLTEDEWQNVHVWAGYVIAGLLVFRLVWGLSGPRYARFTDFVRRPKTVLTHLKEVLACKAQRHIGHNPAGGAMIVTLLVALLVATASGIALYGADQGMGPLASFLIEADDDWIDALEELHEFSANFTLFLVALHVVGVIWESLLHRENLVVAMVTGRKRS